MAYITYQPSDDYFNTVLYTGNGSTQSIAGVGFQPDWMLSKKQDKSKLTTIRLFAAWKRS